MICPDCGYYCVYYDQMKEHYRLKHPNVKGYWKFFTKTAINKSIENQNGDSVK